MTQKIVSGLTVIAMVFAAGLFPGCRNTQTPVLSTGTWGKTDVYFPSRDVTGFRDLMEGDKTPDIKAKGTLYLPAGATPEKKAPAMVILHGSGGEWSGRGAGHARFLAENGIGAFVVDTFTGRGLKRDDNYIQRLVRANFPDQLSDAYAALELLKNHSRVDNRRIGVMGYSLGGISTLLAAYDGVAGHLAISGTRFALHIPFYAPCIVRPENGRTTGAPVVGLWGSLDEATPRPACEALASLLEQGGSPVESVWYPHAAHGWNGKTPMKFYKEVPNFAPCRFHIQSDGSVTEGVAGIRSVTDKEMIMGTEKCVSFGYTIGHHAPTHKAANEMLVRTIRRYMPDPG